MRTIPLLRWGCNGGGGRGRAPKRRIGPSSDCRVCAQSLQLRELTAVGLGAGVGWQGTQALQPGQSGTFLTTGSLTTSESLHLAKTPFHQLKMQMVMMSVKYLVQRGNHRTGRSAKLKGQAPRNARLWARQLTLRQPFLLPTAMSWDSWCFAEMKSQLAMGIWLHSLGCGIPTLLGCMYDSRLPHISLSE